LLVPPQDPIALAAAISELRTAPNLRREFGDRARRDFERSFRLEHTVGKLLTLYATVLGRT
jgi:glycosyltransferase involved in cell wall biosynthesis